MLLKKYEDTNYYGRIKSFFKFWLKKCEKDSKKSLKCQIFKKEIFILIKIFIIGKFQVYDINSFVQEIKD